MPILYDWPLDFPIWSGDLNKANVYWKTEPMLSDGKYLMVTDYSRLDDFTFTLVRTAQSLQNIWNSWTGKGIDSFEWRGRYLYVWLTEASPIASWLIYVIVGAIIAIIGAIAYLITVEIRSIIQEIGFSGKLFLGGLGVALIGGTAVNLLRETKR